MQLNTEDTFELIGLIEEEKKPIPYYSGRFFGEIIEFQSEEILFDEVLGERRMAPFVSPLVAGRVMRSKGSSMKAFKPAYVKPKMVVEPGKLSKRLPGEPIGGGLSPEQRKELTIFNQFREQSEMVDNRLEWMALQALKYGQVVVSGEDYPEQVVDFNRDANLDITVGTIWSDNAATPISDLEAASEAAATAPLGSLLGEVYMPPGVFSYFKNNDEVKDKLDTNYRGTQGVINRDALAFTPEEKPVWVGRIGVFDFYVDARQYEDDAGVMQPFLASDEVLMVSSAVQGAQCFGAIKDIDNLRPARAWPKYWVNQDPPVAYTMTQSAPLCVPRRQNATALLTVL